MKFYRCPHCGKIIAVVKNGARDTICCGVPMVELEPNSTDGAVEKHVPVIEQEGNVVTVKVGSVDHPMLDAHYIEWVMLQTKNGNQRVRLNPGEAPVAKFALLEGDEVVNAFEYCNLHGLFKAR